MHSGIFVQSKHKNAPETTNEMAYLTLASEPQDKSIPRNWFGYPSLYITRRVMLRRLRRQLSDGID